MASLTDSIAREIGPALERFRIPLAILVAVVAAGAGAAITVFVHPVAGFAVLLGLLALAAILVNFDLGVVALVAVLYLLPFGVMPVPLGGVRLTFLDGILTLVLAVWVARMLTNPRYRLITGPFDLLILIFLGLALVSLVIGIQSVTGEIFRFFLKTINSVLVFWSVLNVIRTYASLRLATQATILAAGGCGLIAAGLYLLPEQTSLSLLNSLTVFNYPGGMVLRFIAETDIQRAIGTAIDPNILGGMLMIAVPVIFAQIVSRERVLPRNLLLAAAVLVVAALVLTYSRGAWLGAMGALIGLGSLRYRKMLLLFIPLFALLVILPQGEVVTSRIVGAVEGTDLATQMRVGEYEDAMRLIERYPWFGVGFGGAPDIDLFLGRASAASLFLIIAQQMGLVGLTAFLLVAIAFFIHFSRNRIRSDMPGLQAIQLGFTGAIGAALLGGVVDHYFFNLDFPHTIALYWFFFGMAMAATRLGIEAREGPAERADSVPVRRPAGASTEGSG